MPLKIEGSQSAVAHHVIDGPVMFPYAIDAHSAISRFPKEWSDTPWCAADAAKARKARGEPTIELTPEEQAAIDEHIRAVAEANERLKAFHERKAAEKDEADLVARDEALIVSAPPRPDLTARKALTPAQIRKQASKTDEELAAEKVNFDKTGTL